MAGTVALIWSATPDLIGDIDQTRALLDESALDMDDRGCGGEPGENNIWGQGRLDAYAALSLSPPGPVGALRGSVTDRAGAPIGGATIQASGPASRTTRAGADGGYRLRLPPGTYTVAAWASNFERETATLDVTLRSAQAAVSPASLELLIALERSRTRLLGLTNTGLADLTFAIGERLAPQAAPDGATAAEPPGITSHITPAGYVPTGVAPNLAGRLALVLMDAYPWGSDALQQALGASGIPYDVAGSAQLASIDLSAYQVVFIASDQPQGFYDAYRANLARFEQFVQTGGVLWFGAAAWGWAGGNLAGTRLPGGATVQGPAFEAGNSIADAAHPIVAGVPDLFSGTFASHAAFAHLPPGTTIIARSQGSQSPTLIAYGFGAGRVFALGQTLEFGWMHYQDAGRILEHSLPAAFRAPWRRPAHAFAKQDRQPHAEAGADQRLDQCPEDRVEPKPAVRWQHERARQPPTQQRRGVGDRGRPQADREPDRAGPSRQPAQPVAAGGRAAEHEQAQVLREADGIEPQQWEGRHPAVERVHQAHEQRRSAQPQGEAEDGQGPWRRGQPDGRRAPRSMQRTSGGVAEGAGEEQTGEPHVAHLRLGQIGAQKGAKRRARRLRQIGVGKPPARRSALARPAAPGAGGADPTHRGGRRRAG